MYQELISVIVPVYNAGTFLEPLIKSVLSQTYSNLELLLVDDGSTDGSADICDQYAFLDTRVRVFHQQNGGQSAARNRGLDEAKGSLIAFADHDDYLHPRMYEVLFHGLHSTRAFVCACGFENTPNEYIADLRFDEPIDEVSVVDSREIIHRFFTPAWHIPVWNKLYRREILDDLRFHDARLGEDNLFSYRVIKRCDRIAFCKTTLYFQRMHGMNFEFTGVRHMAELVQAKEKILKDIETSFPAEYRNAQQFFLYECIRVFNLYAKIADPSFELQKKQVFDMMRIHSVGLFHTKLPLGQIFRFYRYRFLVKKPPEHEIVI